MTAKAAGRVFSDYGDQLAAAASDRQGLGATQAPGHLPPPSADGPTHGRTFIATSVNLPQNPVSRCGRQG